MGVSKNQGPNMDSQIDWSGSLGSLGALRGLGLRGLDISVVNIPDGSKDPERLQTFRGSNFWQRPFALTASTSGQTPIVYERVDAPEDQKPGESCKVTTKVEDAKFQKDSKRQVRRKERETSVRQAAGAGRHAEIWADESTRA